MSHERDPFKFCLHCEADCYVADPEHAADCPSSTNLWPVTEKQLGMRGPNDPYAHGMCCMDCKVPFALGDMYTLREVDPGDPDVPGFAGAAVGGVICLGCAAHGVVA